MRLLVALTGVIAACASPAAAKADQEQQNIISHVSCRGDPNEVRIIIRNVKASVGLMTADLYKDEAEGFLRTAGRVKQVRFAARSPVTSFCMTAPEPAFFAVAVYHDKNANMTFDKNPFGLPAEPFGVSNNPLMRFAPPKIEDSVVEVTSEGATVEIDLNN